MLRKLNLKTRLFYLIVFSFVIITSNNVLAQNLPRDHSRWIGDIEGAAVDEQQSGLVYEFKFHENGKVTVYKHMTVRKLEQTFDWEMAGSDIKLTGDDNGPIGELASKTITYVDDTRFAFKYVDGETDIEIKKSKPFISWLHVAFLFALMFFGNELARRYKVAPYLIFFILPIILTPIWLDSGLGWFRITKVYSALAAAIVFTLYRFNFGLNKFKWMGAVIAAVLAINIFEAVMQDWSQPDLPNMLNAFAGFLNIITIYHWSTIKTDPKKPNDMIWPGMTIGWIIAYDIWNIVFVYLNFPNTVFYTAIAVISAPTIAAIWIKKGTWMQARAYTLAIYMMYICTSYMFDLDITFTEPLPRSEGIAWVLVGLSVAVNVIYAFFHFRYRFTGKAPQNLEVGQHESVID